MTKDLACEAKGDMMSSVNFHKCHGGEAAAFAAHAARHDGRDVRYSNEHIDPDLTHANYVVGGGRFGTSARREMSRLRKRVHMIDSELPPKSRRRDRVLDMAYVVTAPAGLEGERLRRFFELALAELAQFSGGRQNISCGWVHMDEIHAYINDEGDWTMSRPHMHVLGVPYVEGKGINAKSFETRERMRALNRSIDERCREELGIGFLTHELQERPGRKVEELKRDSLERLDRKIAERTQELEVQEQAQKVEPPAREPEPGIPDMSWMDAYDLTPAEREENRRRAHREQDGLDEPDGR